MIASAEHLNYSEKVNYGSYYTPKRYVDIAQKWFIKYGLNEGNTIMDPSCGYGAFFQLQKKLNKNRYIGNDIDEHAIENAEKFFPNVEYYNYNLFENVSREKFNIDENEKLIIVGNPPYNDVTSQIHKEIKGKKCFKMDIDIQTRDYGMSSLRCYNKMKADYVVVLHPLSYLIKESNFNCCKPFFKNYELVEHIIFNSQEFNHTSRKMGFPIIVAMYKRNEENGIKYSDVLNYDFFTIEGNSFKLSNRDYVCKFVDKYPSKKRYSKEILFYTLRDINALMRSRTFIKERESNAVDVNPEKIAFYCYIDCFKKYANVPYYMGNFDIPFIYSEFDKIKNGVVQIAQYEHPDIFGANCLKPSDKIIDEVKNYIETTVTFRR